LPFDEDQFDRALSMLVLHFVSDPHQAEREMLRVVRPGGIVAATVWDTLGECRASASSGIPLPQSSLARSVGVAFP
jgi:ubiquinone/menaquinone biosynthesis C-methylase UbiE